MRIIGREHNLFNPLDSFHYWNRLHEKNYNKIIAHYNCEVADSYFSSGDIESGELFLKRALKSNDQCMRALKIEAKNAPQYRCDHCGYTSKRFSWLCPSCKNWGEIHPYEKV